MGVCWGEGMETSQSPRYLTKVRSEAVRAYSLKVACSSKVVQGRFLEKPPYLESELEEEVNVQAEVQKNKDEAKVQGNLYIMEATEAETSEARGQGPWYKLFNCMPAI